MQDGYVVFSRRVVASLEDAMFVETWINSFIIVWRSSTDWDSLTGQDTNQSSSVRSHSDQSINW